MWMYNYSHVWNHVESMPVSGIFLPTKCGYNKWRTQWDSRGRYRNLKRGVQWLPEKGAMITKRSSWATDIAKFDCDIYSADCTCNAGKQCCASIGFFDHVNMILQIMRVLFTQGQLSLCDKKYWNLMSLVYLCLVQLCDCTVVIFLIFHASLCMCDPSLKHPESTPGSAF